MALHGSIQVNGQVLYEWSARRATPSVQPANPYECALYDDEFEVIATAVIDHDYADGAIALAAKVLAWASEAAAEGVR